MEKKIIEDSNTASPFKLSTPGLKEKTGKRVDTLDGREYEVQKSAFGKEESRFAKNNKNSLAKNIASKKRKEQEKKAQKQQTLISKIIYSNNNLMRIDEILQQELMNSNDPGICFNRKPKIIITHLSV